ncbi:MAG: nitrile hydratase [Candidatus Latescibacterota bacterium]|jgi:nitrile hydratase
MNIGLSWHNLEDAMSEHHHDDHHEHHVHPDQPDHAEPTSLLGLPSAWYKSLAYRSRVVSEPRNVLSEFGLGLDADAQIRVYDSTANMRYLVVPQRPAGTDGLSEEELADLVTRDSMIGVATARSATAV